MAKELIKRPRAARKKTYRYRYKVNGRTVAGTFQAVSDAAALKYCGGLLKNKLPKGADVYSCRAVGK